MLAADEAIDRMRWQTIVDMGLLGICTPEAKGGLNLAPIDLIGIAEAAGAVALPEPLVEQAGLAAPLLARLGGPVERVLAGEIIAIGHPAHSLIADADLAGALLLDHAGEVHLVAREAARLTRVESFDPFRRLFRVDWSASPATRLGPWGDTAQRGAVFAAAQMLGLGQRCIDMAVAHARDRHQFGRPIGSYQAVKHLLATAQVKIAFARPVVQAAAAELPLGTAAAHARVAHAKLAAAEAADLAARTAVQVHGAMGMTWEADVHLFLKRALALKTAWGTPFDHRAQVIERMLALPAGPEFTFASEGAAAR
jgi:alkylation response protein AidB-like acyl-CoA dehydrogenase